MFEDERNQRATAGVEAHVREFFTGHMITVSDHDPGPGRRNAVPDLRILTVSPGPRADSWAYLTAGCWSTAETDGHGLEFVLTAPVRDERFADLLAMTASYHSDHHLDLEHSLPIGEPWLPGSPATTCWSAFPTSTDLTSSSAHCRTAMPASSGFCRSPQPRWHTAASTATKPLNSSSTSTRSSRPTQGVHPSSDPAGLSGASDSHGVLQSRQNSSACRGTVRAHGITVAPVPRRDLTRRAAPPTTPRPGAAPPHSPSVK